MLFDGDVLYPNSLKCYVEKMAGVHAVFGVMCYAISATITTNERKRMYIPRHMQCGSFINS